MMVYQFNVLVIIFVMFILQNNNHCHSLHINYLHVPHTAWGDVQIDCKYSLKPGEQLYDVKWYKDEQQFFRCAADGTVQSYDVSGITIAPNSPSKYTSSVGSCPVILTALDSKSSGTYLCEVTLDNAAFDLAQKQQEMRVVPQPMRQFQDTDLETEGATTTEKGTERQNISGSKSTSLATFVLVFFIFIFCSF